MHELSIATELLETCERSMDGHGGGRLKRVRIAVGDRTGVEAELLAFAWEALVAGGPHAGAALDVTLCPSRQTCEDCGGIAERMPGSWLRLCPRCGRPLVVEGGDELDVLEIRFDAPEPASPPAR